MIQSLQPNSANNHLQDYFRPWSLQNFSVFIYVYNFIKEIHYGKQNRAYYQYYSNFIQIARAIQENTKLWFPYLWLIFLFVLIMGTNIDKWY